MSRDAASRVRILLVDDQPARLLTYRTVLEPLDEILVEARSGVEALERLMEEEFAVILLDVNMPDMDGFETAAVIHRHPRYEHTPIIFVTAVNVTDMDRLRGYKLGAVDYVMVPVIPEILRGKVGVLAELYRKRRQLQAANAALEEANLTLQARQERELEELNASLRQANAALEAQNVELHGEIAERRRIEQLLRTADRRKDEFLATLAHELRNPLAPLQNALSVRRLAGTGDDLLQGTMERQLALLVRLIDDLLDISRIRQGKLALRRVPTGLRELVDMAIELARPVIEQGRHPLRVVLPDESLALDVDAVRLSQVFANLLNNAAKYSDAGAPIELRASADPACGTVRVQVADSGVGLAPEQLGRIFEMFSQVESSSARAQGGLGIGLTLVRHLVEMHGGSITATSPGLGQGATFEVALPASVRVSGASPRAVVPLPSNQVRGGRGRRVLVVDDNQDAANTLAMVVEMLGHEVCTVYDPGEVVERARSFGPDLVFLDLGLPGISGCGLAPLLRGLPGGEALEIVAVTGWGQPEDRRRTRDAGFDLHLVKPPAFDDIERLCSRRPRGEATEQADG